MLIFYLNHFRIVSYLATLTFLFTPCKESESAQMTALWRYMPERKKHD